MSGDSNSGSTGANNSDKGKRLRRPRPETHERLMKGEIDTEKENIMKSTLSASAPEFVPKYAMIYPDPAGAQDPLYQDFQRLVNIRPSHLSAASQQGPQQGNVADEFKEALFRLTSNPGPTEEFMKRIIDILMTSTPEPEAVADMINTLFEQSISEPNFRFTGAKISNILSNGLKNHQTLSGFRGLFLRRCKDEFDLRQQLLATNLERLCGVAMFFGELFLVLEIEVNGVQQKIGILRGAIADLLTTLLSKPDDVTVKCAMQLLKLTGTALMETTDLPGSFDETFAKTKSLEKHPDLNKTSHCLINSVLSRLEYNFGVGQQVSPQKPQASPNTSFSSFNNEPIFYNAAGEMISREEAGYANTNDESDFIGMTSEEQEAYLQWEANLIGQDQDQWAGPDMGGAWSSNGGAGGSDTDYAQWSTDQGTPYGQYDEAEYYSDYGSEMDDEMAAAYEMFLKESGQSRH